MAGGQRQRLGGGGLAGGFEGGLAAVAVGLGTLLDEPAAATWHGSVSGLLLGSLASLPMLAGFFLAVRWPVGPLRPIKEFSDTVVRPLFAPCSVIDLGLI